MVGIAIEMVMEARRRRPVGPWIAITLNRSPIWSGAVSRTSALRIIAGPVGMRAGKRLGAGGDTQSLQPFTWVTSGLTFALASLARGERFEIDVAGQILLPGRSSSAAKAWPRTACSVSPGASAHGHNRRSMPLPRSAKWPGDCRRRLHGARANLDNLAVAIEGEPARVAITRRSIPPTAGDRQGVEKFVGDQQQRTAR